MKLVRTVEPTRLAAKVREDGVSPRNAGKDPRRVSAYARAVARALGPLLNEEESLRAIGRMAVGDLADVCWVHLVDAGGEPHLAGAWQCEDVAGVDLPEDHDARLRTVLRTRLTDFAGTGASPASLIVPLWLEDVSAGALTLSFTARRPRPGHTETSMAEDLALHAAAAIERSRVHAHTQKSLSSRDDSFAAAAHELGNPLNALLLQVTALIRTANVERRTMARIFAIERLIRQLVDLNHRMLDTSRLAAGQFQLRREDVDLSAIVQDVLANNADQLAWSKCSVSFTSPGPVVGQWDRLRLEQVVSNLVSNAMKYGYGGAIAVSVEATADIAKLSVRDHGIGIAAQDHERIFERFERAAPMQASTSLGLGLWVVRQVVSALGGSVRVESSLGAGATFTVELPRKSGSVEAS